METLQLGILVSVQIFHFLLGSIDLVDLKALIDDFDFSRPREAAECTFFISISPYSKHYVFNWLLSSSFAMDNFGSTCSQRVTWLI